MAYVNRIRRSGEGTTGEAGKKPTPGELIYGEIAVNAHDGTMHTIRSSGGGGPNIVEFRFHNENDYGDIFTGDHGTITAPVTILRDMGTIV